ncbi:uncharacterized protein VTP21DRAFT_6554 [Calcarisporiella thermophila]|uniref:uncharacterized protein n=1 Tax=Calcarisporiella thermophila TaxID=911321 RepID=UPI003743E3A1
MKDTDTLSKTLTDFQRASNSKINYHKSEAVPLSATARATLSPPCDFTHEERTFTLLGIPFNTKKIFPGDEYFEELLIKLWKTVKTWRLRALSLKGKALLINSKLLSKLWYTAKLIPPPAKFLKQLDTIVKDFLWDKKRPQIALTSWFQHFATTSSYRQPWASLAICTLEKHYTPNALGMGILATRYTQHKLMRKDGLRPHLVRVWQSLGGKLDLTKGYRFTLDEVLPLLISNNSYFTIEGAPVKGKAEKFGLAKLEDFFKPHRDNIYQPMIKPEVHALVARNPDRYSREFREH